MRGRGEMIAFDMMVVVGDKQAKDHENTQQSSVSPRRRAKRGRSKERVTSSLSEHKTFVLEVRAKSLESSMQTLIISRNTSLSEAIQKVSLSPLSPSSLSLSSFSLLSLSLLSFSFLFFVLTWIQSGKKEVELLLRWRRHRKINSFETHDLPNRFLSPSLSPSLSQSRYFLKCFYFRALALFFFSYIHLLLLSPFAWRFPQSIHFRDSSDSFGC